MYRTAGMFGGVNAWRIAKFKVFGWLKFGEEINLAIRIPFIS